MDNCIVVIIGESRYGVLVRAAQEIAEGFRQFSGIPVVEVDLAEEKNWEVFVDALVSRKIQPKFIFCMQAVGFDVHTTKGNLFFDRFPYPLFGWIFDHPYYHGSRVECLNGGNRILACINQSDTDYIERYFPGKATKLFLPHGGFSSKYAFNLNFRDRIPAVFFSGGYLAVEESLQKIEELHETHQYLVKQWTAKFLKKLGGGSTSYLLTRMLSRAISGVSARRRKSIDRSVYKNC